MPTAPVTISNISLSQNPAPFLSNIEFSFTFEAHQTLSAPLEWKIIYVGSVKDESYDQILEEFEINSIDEKTPMKFNVDCSPPNYEKIPRKQLLCITAIIITVSYKQQQFIRIGYYVHLMASNELTQEEKASMSTKELVKCLTRTILIDKPRITQFKIEWDDKKESLEKQQRVHRTPVKNEKTDHSNSLLSISKTSCNQKQQSQADLSPLPKFSKKKAKKIRKQILKQSS